MKFNDGDDNDMSNVEDRRGATGKKIAFGGVGAVVLLLIGKVFFPNNPIVSSIINNVANNQQQTSVDTTQKYVESADEKVLSTFSKRVFHSCDAVWTDQFKQMSKRYSSPTFLMYTDNYPTACGQGSAAMGPFYCPGDNKIYIDLSFFQEMKTQFNATGDFARAYVVAHEFGHHIQNLLGTTNKLDQARGQVSEKEYNKLSVKLELQADFLAGYWSYWAKKRSDKYGIQLDDSDLEAALNTASQIGDDMLQKKAQGRVVPDAFTHGTSEQRMYWFKKGYETGDLTQGDTFNDPSLN